MQNDVRSALTENLNELMKVKKIKAVDLAEAVGVSKSAVSHWLAGDNSPNIEILAKICQIYGVKLSEMLNEKIEITYADKELLKKYHLLDTYGKKAVDGLLETEYERCTAQKPNIVRMRTASRSFGDEYKQEIIEDDINDYINAPENDIRPVR